MVAFASLIVKTDNPFAVASKVEPVLVVVRTTQDGMGHFPNDDLARRPIVESELFRRNSSASMLSIMPSLPTVVNHVITQQFAAPPNLR